MSNEILDSLLKEYDRKKMKAEKIILGNRFLYLEILFLKESQKPILW